MDLRPFEVASCKASLSSFNVYFLALLCTSQVEWLLDQGFSIDQQDLSGQTALAAATQHNRVMVVQLLLKRGAQTELGVEGWTPLSQHGRRVCDGSAPFGIFLALDSLFWTALRRLWATFGAEIVSQTQFF